MAPRLCPAVIHGASLIDVEILTIGDELLRGELVDENAAWLAQRLAELGMRVRRLASVGDGLDEIVAVVKEAAARSALLVVTGGLGPTADDRTADAVALAAGVPRVPHPPSIEAIRARFARAGFPYTANNDRQGHLPAGADPLPNERGTAPGFALTLEGCRVFCFPGVPSEMHWMCETYLVPWLVHARSLGVRSRKVFKLFGLGESHVDAKLEGLPGDEQGCELSLHYRAKFPEVHVTLIARGADAARVEAVAEAKGAEIARRLDRFVFARGDVSFGEAVVSALREAGHTVALAESCTGGLVGDLLTRAPGASQVFELGLVAYSNRLKQQLLSVPAALLEREGAVSRTCVEAMACEVRRLAGASFGIAISGIAGPGGGTVQKPVGTVHFALAWDGGVRHLERVFPYDRQRNKLVAAYAALWLLLEQLRNRGVAAAADPFDGRWSAR